MHGMLRYHLGGLGKRGAGRQSLAGKALRPALCLLACEATVGTYQQALPAAVALELVHGASLIYDDIQDEDPERRHRPTVWAIWGKRRALGAGTAMASLAGLALSRLSDLGVPAERRLRAERLLGESCIQLVEGQYLDISYEARLDIGVPDYLAMAEKKSATLIACALGLGALIGSGDESAVQAFRHLGQSLGLAFQIRDDILGIWGDQRKTGKPVGSDIRRRKKSLPIIYAMGQAQGNARVVLSDIYGRPPGQVDAPETVLGMLDSVEAQAHAQRMVQGYCESALADLDRLCLPAWARSCLEAVACFLAGREI